MAVAAQAGCFQQLDRDFRDDRDAVHALLAGKMDVRIAGRFECLARKLVLQAFDLLQAQHVRLLPLQESGDAGDTEADRIDVPGRQSEAFHACGQVGSGGGLDKPRLARVGLQGKGNHVHRRDFERDLRVA